MARKLDFSDQVVIITGAGNGLGRCHAKLFAEGGAKVVVNDLGGGSGGDGASQNAADKVVAEIREAGGEAVANYDSVEFGDKIVQTALDTYGRVDVVVNNAGILRDKSFHNLSDEDWQLIFLVHVLGAYRVTAAAWPHFREQRYGRVIMTTSAAGIYGNFGQSNYSAAKLALLGFSNTLAIEGQKRNIHVNTIAPLAASRLTKGIVPDAMFDALQPELVSPLVAWLCHSDCKDTGGVYEVGGGFFAKLRWERAAGKLFRLGRNITPESIRDAWADITSFEKSEHPKDIRASMAPVVDNLSAGKSRGGNEFIDVDVALGVEIPEFRSSYSSRDASIYALGVGAGADPTDDTDLQLVYENHSKGFRVLPSFSVAPVIGGILAQAAEGGGLAPGLNFGLDRLLHGEQTTEMLLPLPASAKLRHRSKVVDIFDKGKGALVVIETTTSDESGNDLVRNTLKAFIRGAGGWGGESGPSTKVNVPPERSPDHSQTQKTGDDQALLYRLSGDWNPLHVDPGFAKAFGFERPILHGLCTYGYATRHVVEKYAGGDPRLVKSIHSRFADSVFPGETIETRMWQESPTRIIFECRVPERDAVVISHAAIELYEEIPKAPEKAAAIAAPAADAPAQPTAADAFDAIGAQLKKHPELAANIGKVYEFQLSDPDSVWTLDLKTGGGAVSAGSSGAAECTLALSEPNFMAMAEGSKDPMKLYLGGELKISGDVLASQKLDFLKQVEAPTPKAGRSPAASPEPAGPASLDVFIGMGIYVEQHPELVMDVGKTYLFELSEPESVWTLDLKNGAGSVSEGGERADCTLRLSEADFVAMAKGEKDPMKLYMGGSLKIDGDLLASQKLGFLQSIDGEKLAPEIAKRKAAKNDASAPKPASKPKRQPAAQGVFEALVGKAKADGKLRAALGQVIHFEVSEPDSRWRLQLETDSPLANDFSGPAAATFSLSDRALQQLAEGTSAKDLFQRGQLRISGDRSIAHALDHICGLLTAQE